MMEYSLTKIGTVNTRTKIHILIVAAVIFIVATIFLSSEIGDWNKYSNPTTVKNVRLGLYPANDYAIEGTSSYYYLVVADVRYTRGTWPKTNSEILKSDTLLVLHNCSGD